MSAIANRKLLATENFLIPPHLESIKEENKIYSATGSGRIPWVSTHDIAAVGVHALTTAQPPNTDLLILGPELLTYSDVSLSLFTAFPFTSSPLSLPTAYPYLRSA